MPGGRKRNIMKRQQEESSRNLMTFLTGQGIHHDISDTAVRTWPGGEPFKSPEKETGERARECGVCKMRTNTKKCTGCYSAWFCGVDCQRKAWPDHKRQCKVVRGRYSVCHLNTIPFNVLTNYLTGKNFQSRASGFTKQQCVLKIQLECSLAWKPIPGGNMMVYDRERSFSFNLQKELNPEVYPRLHKIITERGVWGLKGYFQAIKSPAESGKSDKTVKVEIDIENILPRQDW